MEEQHVIVNNYYLLAVSLLAVIGGGYMLYGLMNRIDDKWVTKKRRRKKHLNNVNASVTDLRYKIINLALRCERGDLSLTAFNRRTLNAARLIRRYESKKAHLKRYIG